MEIKDKIYGDEEIKEDVLIDLINSDSVQRLKGVAQWGIPNEYYHKKNGFSRYDHSVGVMMFLRKMGANLNEQIAGLLHDVSHTAFSHVIDWAIGDPTKEDYQDNIHEEMIENSEIPKILSGFGFDFKELCDIGSFLLLEREAPLLCADRIDYTLRELESEKELNLVNDFFRGLLIKNNELVFREKSIGELFGREYARLQNEHWASAQARARYYVLASVLNNALESEIISYDDLRKTDNYILDLLSGSKNKEILKNLDLLRKGFIAEDVEEGIELKKKFRYVDPGISVNGSIKRLSEVSEEYRDFINLEKDKSKLVRKIKIIPIEDEHTKIL